MHAWVGHILTFSAYKVAPGRGVNDAQQFIVHRFKGVVARVNVRSSRLRGVVLNTIWAANGWKEAIKNLPGAILWRALTEEFQLQVVHVLDRMPARP